MANLAFLTPLICSWAGYAHRAASQQAPGCRRGATKRPGERSTPLQKPCWLQDGKRGHLRAAQARGSLCLRASTSEPVQETADEAPCTDGELEALAGAFPFRLDGFQARALQSILQSRSVVVSVPTGSGKTVIGEGALILALRKGMRAFYTTPLKALSNQKFGDFCDRFGVEKVGLLTGDVSIRPDAPILVMTTEVYRNMLYRCRTGVLAELSMTASATGRDAKLGNNDEPAPSTNPGDARSLSLTLNARYLDDLYAVVFDEFHYMNDRERGTVWEEAVISSPTHTILVALSATMRNAAEICEWFHAVHGTTDLIVTNDRPVPLDFLFADANGVRPLLVPAKRSGDDKSRGFARSRQRGARANSKVPTIDGRFQLNPELVWSPSEAGRMASERRQRWRESGDPNLRRSAEILERQEARRERDRFRGNVPSYPFLVRCLRSRRLLPAIIFLFSRSGCDRAVADVLRERRTLKLVSKPERAAIEARMEEFFASHPELRTNPDAQKRYESMIEGIAAHHAGLLPLWKALVEQLFQANLIKVVFATETLAAGINMPARSTVITALSKRAGSEGIVRLTPNEFLQMAGRAGRRGMDDVGYVVVMQSAWEPSAQTAFQLLQRGTDPLRSNFVPTYGMALNLLRHPGTPLQSAQRYLERSFGSFLASRGRLGQWKPEIHDEMESLERQVKETHAMLSVHGGEKAVAAYDKLLERLRSEERILGYLEEQHEESAVSVMEDLLVFSDPGTQVLLPDQQERALLAGVIVERRVDAPLRFALVATDGRLRICGPRYVAAVLSREPLVQIALPTQLLGLAADALDALSWRQLFAASSRYGEVHETAEPIMESHFMDRTGDNPLDSSQMTTWEDLAASPLAVPEIRRQRKIVDDLRTRLAGFTLHQHPDCEVVLKTYRSLGMTETQLGRLRHRMMRQTMQATATESWNIFRALVDVLERFGCLERTVTAPAEAMVSSPASSSTKPLVDSEAAGDDLVFFRLTDFGALVAGLRVENELWAGLAMVHAEQHLASLAPQELAGVAAALAADSGLPPGAHCRFLPSARALEICREVLGPLQEQLSSAQREALEAYWSNAASEANSETMLPNINLSPDLMGIVEAWAQGVSWSDLLNGLSLDEGDVVRLIRRSMDILRQIPSLGIGAGWHHRPASLVSSRLALNARRALTLLDRYPVADSSLERAGEAATVDLTNRVSPPQETTLDSDPETFWSDESVLSEVMDED
jgi:superfamily II RNA helicase